MCGNIGVLRPLSDTNSSHEQIITCCGYIELLQADYWFIVNHYITYNICSHSNCFILLIKHHLSKEGALCLKLYFFYLHPPRAIEIDSAVNEHLLLRTFHWINLPEHYTRLAHVHIKFSWFLVSSNHFPFNV